MSDSLDLDLDKFLDELIENGGDISYIVKPAPAEPLQPSKKQVQSKTVDNTSNNQKKNVMSTEISNPWKLQKPASHKIRSTSVNSKYPYGDDSYMYPGTNFEGNLPYIY
jgi:uncharacterized membrane protein YcaP (DUF421 family)